MGNPHAVIVVEDIARAPVAAIGPMLQAAGDFPQGVNVGFAQVVSPGEIHLRVFERGAGETLACGSGACAAVAVLVRQGRVGRHVDVHLPGGTLVIDWPDDSAPRAHGRAGDIRIRRGVAGMSEEKKERLSAHEVAVWLRRHPRSLPSIRT